MSRKQCRYLKKEIVFLGKALLCFVSIYCLSFFVTKILQEGKKSISFDPSKFAYNCELEGSPIYSPDKHMMLSLKLAFNVSTGGNAYLFGNVSNADGSGDKIIYIDRCVIFRSPNDDSIKFRYVMEPTFTWENANIIIINGHEIDIRKSESFIGEFSNNIFD